MNQPLISIIIVNYNGQQFLKRCFESLLAQDYKNIEILLVDNASTDESVHFTQKTFPQIKIIKNSQNYGFAKGNNIGVSHAKGEYLLLLNSDAFVDKKAISTLLKAFAEIPHLGSVQPKLVIADRPDVLDVCGSYWTDTTILYHYGYMKPANLPQYNIPKPFFSNKGACMLIKKELFIRLGLFDDDFWCYYEETDLCHRIWLAGYECWYYPQALVYHKGGGSQVKIENSIIHFNNYKNKLCSFLKNFEGWQLLKIIPIYFTINIPFSFIYLVQRRPRVFFAFYKSIWWNIQHLHDTMKKRKVIQSLRKKTDTSIMSVVKKNPGFYYYWLPLGPEHYKDI